MAINGSENLVSEEIEKIKKSKKYKKIRKNLSEQLFRNGNDQEYLVDLVDDYMNMWVTKELLFNDIGKRGVRVAYNNGGGQCGYKKNESVDQMMKLNAQMLKLLSELKLSPSNELDGDDDGEL